MFSIIIFCIATTKRRFYGENEKIRPDLIISEEANKEGMRRKRPIGGGNCKNAAVKSANYLDIFPPGDISLRNIAQEPPSQ